MSVDGDVVRFVETASRQRAYLRPALEGEAERGATPGAEVDMDLESARVRGVVKGADTSAFKFNRAAGKDRFDVERGARESLAERAVTCERSLGPLRRAKPDARTEAAADERSEHREFPGELWIDGAVSRDRRQQTTPSNTLQATKFPRKAPASFASCAMSTLYTAPMRWDSAK